MAAQFTLGKNERLKSRKQIEALFAAGQRMHVPNLRVTWLTRTIKENEWPIQFGVGVSTRFFKKAVDRNRIKRLIREAWRLQKNEFQEKLREQKRHLDVFIIYTGKDIPSYEDITTQVSAVLKKISAK